MVRILIDTNVLVAAAYNSGSASRRIVDAVQDEKLKLIVSPAVVQEYEAILPRAIRSQAARDQVWQSLKSADHVVPQKNPPVTEDRSDDKFLAAAVAGDADVIVTSDRHLLAAHPYEGVAILQPMAFWDWLFDHLGDLE